MKKVVLLLAVGLALSPAAWGGEARTGLPRWSEQRAWAWYNRQPWIVGFNYVPSTAGNTTEIWQKESFDPETIDRELGWAEQIGYNSARIFIQYLVWKDDPEGLERRFERFLAIAARHKISVMPVFFDDCAFGDPPQLDPYLGKQRDPIPGMIASNWTPSPGRKAVQDTGEWPTLKRYVQDLITAHREDKRVLMWDLYNEPMNTAQAAMYPRGPGGLTLLEAAFAWAREAKPTQPITVAVWAGRPLPGSQTSLDNSDVITFHMYADHAGLKREIERLKKLGRPVVNTEWMARARGSDFKTDLPLFKSEKVGCYQWGLVNGRMQCQFPWWNKRGDPVDPKTGWFHDILHRDGRPYRKAEVEAIKRIISR